MSIFRTASPHAAAALAALVALGFGAAPAGAQSEDVRVQELRTMLGASVDQNRVLQAEIDQLRRQNANLGQSLRAANEEAESYRQSYDELRVRMEALGINAVTEGTKGVEDRLAKALGDVILLERHRDTLSSALIAMADTALRFADTATGGDEMARASLEAAIDTADAALADVGGAEAPLQSGDLHDCQVVSVKKDYGVVILNVGREAGVRIGMPFEVRRVDRPIANVIVVDRRDHICAALVKDLIAGAENPQVGDAALVATTN